MKTIRINRESGAVSLFVVIFFMLIVTVVTVSFVRLMINDERQSSDTDLSQSAYDSSQAGVEDAKRALLAYQKRCSADLAACPRYADNLSTTNCNEAVDKFLGVFSSPITAPYTPVPDGVTPEVKVQTTQSGSNTDATLNQAYTCVTIKLKTEDYVGNLDKDNPSKLVPLIGETAFDRVRVQWFNKDDLDPSTGSTSIDLLGVSAGKPLVEKGSWPLSRPALMRAQLIQFADSFTPQSFDTFDNSDGATKANTATMFLYPTSETQAAVGEKAFTSVDSRKTTALGDPSPKTSDNTPASIHCEPNLNAGGYACSADLVLPRAVGASDATDTAFLRLTALYNTTHFRVLLSNGPFTDTGPSTIVKFKDVQPEIDSTGRANDVFRRTLSRVDLYDTSFSYPEATVDVTGDFCKDFSVTNTQYITGTSSCNP
jgi:Tfp pilus assembly protein PilX